MIKNENRMAYIDDGYLIFKHGISKLGNEVSKIRTRDDQDFILAS